MPDAVGMLLKKKRKEENLSVKDVTEKLHAFGIDISDKTLYGWESGHRQPDADTFLTLCQIYGIKSISEVVNESNDTEAQLKNAASIPDTAQKVAKDYSRLDEHGKRVVCSVILEERRRIESEYQWQKPKVVYSLCDYLQTASAGYGDFNDDASYEVVDLVKRPPIGASFLITINGDSMEPTYHDGDKLFIKAQETLNIGEVGLFAVGSDLYIKEYGADGLISHNPKYPIKRPEMDTIVKVYGKVLGVCTDDYFGK